ncbi:hypothetical protein Tco_0006186 [Tanacetum coccineum]
MEDDLFTYELGVLEDFYFLCVEQPYDNLKNGDLDIYEPRQCYDEYKRIIEAVILTDDRLVKLIYITLEQWLDLKFGDHKKVNKEIVKGVVGTWLIRSYKKQFEEYMEIKRRLEVNEINTDVECDPTDIEFAKGGDDEEVLTYDDFSDLEEENLSEDNEIAKIIRIEIDIFDFETPLYKEFKDFNHLLQIDVDALTRDLLGFKTYADYKMQEYWWGKKDDEESSEDAWSNNLPNDDNDAIQANQERFDDHEPIEGDDDDIGDLDDYLIPQDAFYYVDEEEERFKERKSKLLGIPYEKPPTFKFEKLEVIKYSLGLVKEYVAIRKYEYDLWVRIKENVSHVYQEIFCKKYFAR